MIRSIGMLLLLIAAGYGVYTFLVEKPQGVLSSTASGKNLSPLIQRLLTMVEKNGGFDQDKSLPYSIQQSVNVNPSKPVVPRRARSISKPRRPTIRKNTRPGSSPKGQYHVQAAVCYFQACANEYRALLEQESLKVAIEDRRRTLDVYEVISKDKFSNAGEASVFALRINEENKMEGRAYVRQLDGGYVISLGQFPSRARANRVVFALNRQFEEGVTFSTHAGKSPYSVQLVLGGSYATREQAEAVLSTLKNKYDKLVNAQVVSL